MTKSRNINAPRRIWADAEIRVLRDLYPLRSAAGIARVLTDMGWPRHTKQVHQKAHSLGLRKSTEWIASQTKQAMANPLHGGRITKFQAGLTPWNKGIPGSAGLHPNSRATQFSKGRPAQEASNYVPTGSLRVTKDGYLERKFTDDTTLAPARRWVAEHRLVWEAAHGPIPAGHVVIFRPGQKTTDPALVTLDRLEIISRVDLMRRNSVHTKYPPELARLAQLRGAITRQINKRARPQGD